MKESPEIVQKRLQDIVLKRADDRKEKKEEEKRLRREKWRKDLVLRMKTKNPMFDPLIREKVSMRMKGNRYRVGKKSGVIQDAIFFPKPLPQGVIAYKNEDAQ